MSISIPSLHVTSIGQVKGGARVFIQKRTGGGHAGTFDIQIAVKFNPATDDYPVLSTLVIRSQLSDTMFNPPGITTFTATTVELLNSYGKDTPTIYITGRCNTSNERYKGCKYWVLIVNNKTGEPQGTPDIAGFAIIDRNGDRVAYGTGPVQAGDLNVEPGP